MPAGLILNLNETDEEYLIANKHLRKSDLRAWKKFNMDEDITVKHEAKIRFPKHQSKAGQNAGLSLLLNPSLDEYFCSAHDGYGYRIFAHSPIEFPHVLEFGGAMGPNVELFMNLQAVVTMAEKDIKDLKPEERHCYFLNEKKLANYRHYTSNNCIDECIMNKTVLECNCVLNDMHQSASKSNKASFCEGSNFTCAKNIKKQLGKLGTKHFCQSCFSNCNRILYDAQTSSLPIRNDVNIWKHLDPMKRKDWSNKNVSIVHIFFGSDSVYTRVRKRLFGFSELFANVGGFLGLFIGFSVISLVEPCYFLMRMLTNSSNEDEEDNDED